MNIYSIKSILSIIFFLLIFISCTDDRPTDNSNEHFFIDAEYTDKASMKDVFSNVEIIPLETSDQSLIANLDCKIVVHKSKFYLLDRREFAILIFDVKGRFLEKIQNIGKGPGEYLDLYDFNINPYTGNLELMSPRGKLIEYDEVSKQFKTLLHLPGDILSIHRFIHISEDIIVFYSFFEIEQLIFYSRKNSKIINKELININGEKIIRMLPRTSPFSFRNNAVYFVDPYSYNTYNLDSERMVLFNSLDFGKYNFNLSSIPNSERQEPTSLIAYIERNAIVFPIDGYFENDDLIGYSFHQNRKFKTAVIDKNTSSNTVFSHHDRFYPFITSDGNKLIGCILMSEFAKEVFPPGSLDEKNQAILQNISPNDNPILVRYSLK
jgi:hypothetical protein